MSLDESQRLYCIEENQKLILDTVNQLKMAVIGSDLIGVEGLVPKVRRHENYIENDKKQKWMLAGGVVAIGGIISFILNYVK